MDARLTYTAIFAAAFFSLGASHRTENFIVTAPTKSFAVEVATTAEEQRRDLAVQWLGRELPPWREPCPIRVHVGDHLGAGGATVFSFINRRPTGWKMTIQGTQERVLDSVLPHEITHTIFATHFGRPLPRWADEGACTTVEHISERRAQHDHLIRFLNTERGIPFKRMFALREYPRDVMPLYSQGYSVVRYLIYQGGERKFVDFLADGMRANDWNGAVKRNYGFDDLSDLQLSWVDWIKKGSTVAMARQGSGFAARRAKPDTNVLASITNQAQDRRQEGSPRQGAAESRTESAGAGNPYAANSYASPPNSANTNSANTKAAQSQPSRSEVNWYVMQATLAAQGHTTEKRAGRWQTANMPSEKTRRHKPLPAGRRSIMMEWRAEPKMPQTDEKSSPSNLHTGVLWSGNSERVIR